MSRGTLIFGALVLALIGFTVFDHKKTEKDETRKSEESVVVKLKADQVSEIEISRSANPIKMKKEGTEWKLLEPVADLADQSAVTDLVDSLTREKASETAKEGDNDSDVDWKIFGLDNPKAVFQIKGGADNSSPVIKVAVGSRKNFEGSTFLRLNADKKVLVSSAVWDTNSGKTVKDFRDKRGVRNPLSGADKMELKTDAKSVSKKDPTDQPVNLSLVRKDQDWSSPKNPVFKLDPTKVREILTVLGELKVTDFVSEAPDLKKVIKAGSATKTLKLQIAEGANGGATAGAKVFQGELVAEIPKEAKEGAATYYWSSSELPRVVKLETAGPEKLFKLSLDGLRNREEPFVFAVEEVKSIHSENSLKMAHLENKNGNWEIAQPAEGMEVDQSQVKPFLDKIRALRVGEFKEKFKDKMSKLASILTNKIALVGGDGKTVFELKWSKETFEIKDGKTSKKYYAVTTNKTANIFAVEENNISNLNPQSLLKAKAVPQAATDGAAKAAAEKAAEAAPPPSAPAEPK